MFGFFRRIKSFELQKGTSDIESVRTPFVEEGGVRGVGISQNLTELRINTAQNNKKTANRIKITRKFLNTANHLVL